MTSLPYETALTGLCLWESVVAPDDGSAKPWDDDRENEGTCALRDSILGMASLCDSDYAAARLFGYDDAMDWAFAPAWLAHNYAALRDGQRRCVDLERAARISCFNLA